MKTVDYIKNVLFLLQCRKHKPTLGEAASALYHLNRHIRHASRCKHKDSIYPLKNEFIKLMYQQGKCPSVKMQKQVQKCWHTWRYNNGYDDYCEKCDDTGIYAEHILYKFVVDAGRHYSWHQPERFVEGVVPTSTEITDFGKVTDERPYYKLGNRRIKMLSGLLWAYLVNEGVDPKKLPSAGSLKQSVLQDLRWYKLTYQIDHHRMQWEYRLRELRWKIANKIGGREIQPEPWDREIDTLPF